MKSFVLQLLLAAALLAATATASAQKPDERSLVWVEYGTTLGLSQLANAGFDIWEADGARALVYANEAELAIAAARGHRVVPADDDLVASATRMAVDGYYTPAEYDAEMQAWATNYPSIVSLSSIGITAEGRPLRMLKISDNVGTDEGEPEVILMGLQHAREWLGGMTLRGITEHLITGYTTNTQVADLVNGLEIYVILVSNPDGFAYTHSNVRLWRKNRRNNGNGTFGVDLNRNWPLKWELAPTSTSSDTYRGPSPLSELENQALNNFITSRGSSLVGLLNYHSYGNLVMHNWAWTYDPPPNVSASGPLVQSMANAIAAVNGQSQTAGAWAVALGYTGGGVTDDYLHSEYGIPSVTLEGRPYTSGQGGFTPTGALIAPTVAEHIPGAMTYLSYMLNHATDATAPVISNLAVTPQSASSITVSWETDDPADAAVEYGTTIAYGTAVQPNRLRSFVHSITLTGLQGNTTYHLRARSSNLAGLTGVSGDLTYSSGTPKAGIDWTGYE